MKGSRIAVTCLVAATLISSLAFVEREKSRKSKPIGRIAVSAIGNQIELVSDLGEPLETLVTLRGEMVPSDYFKELQRNKVVPDPSEYVKVLQVDNRALDEPVVIQLHYNWHHDNPPKPGTPVELIGYSRLLYVGESPVEMRWNSDPRNRHEGPPEEEVARAIIPGHYEDRFAVLQFDKLPPAP